MRVTLLTLSLFIALISTNLSAEVASKDGALYEEIDMRNNNFSLLDQSKAVIRTLIELDWHIANVGKESIEADYDGKSKLRVDLSKKTITITEVSNNFIFEREWFPKIRARIIRELLYVGHVRQAEMHHSK